jgi:hypothetical protein
MLGIASTVGIVVQVVPPDDQLTMLYVRDPIQIVAYAGIATEKDGLDVSFYLSRELRVGF